MAVNTNLNNLIQSTLSKNLADALSHQDRKMLISTHLEQAKKTYDSMEILNNKIKNYNQAYRNIVRYNNIVRQALDKGLSEEWANSQYAQYTPKRLTFKKYAEGKHQIDWLFIQTYENLLERNVKKGYSSIMQLRKLFTGQEIIYAIEHTDAKSGKTYQVYMDEEEYLKLFSVKRTTGENAWDIFSNITKISNKTSIKKSFQGKNDTGSILSSGLVIDKSNDPIYQHIAQYQSALVRSKKNVLKNYDLFEIYTAMKARFKVINYPDRNVFKAINEFIENKSVTYEHIYAHKVNDGWDTTSTIQALAFYQGGDSTYWSSNGSVGIQNKGDDARVNVGTIFNGLKYIVNNIKPHFDNFNIKELQNNVTKMFTASKFNEVSKGVSDRIYRRANTDAQDYISKVCQGMEGVTFIRSKN